MRTRSHTIAAGLLAIIAACHAMPQHACAADPSPPAAITPAQAPDSLAAELNRRLTEEVTPLLTTYCFECHQGPKPKGDVHLDDLKSLQAALELAPDLRRISEVVSTSEMPPKKKPQPTDAERAIITQWTNAALDFVPADAPIDPGWFTIHRLNRSEYRNTLRDLLGIDPRTVDLAAKLPRDDTGYGFDNIADVLSTSPLAVEQYLETAENAIDLALGPILEFSNTPHALRPIEGDHGHALPRGGFFLYSNGFAAASAHTPATGEYILRIRAWETHGGDENAILSLRINEKQVREFFVAGTQDNPNDFEIHLRLEKGGHDIAAHFTNDYYVPKIADRNLAIESMSLAGPLDESTTERPFAYRQIITPFAAIADETSRAAAILKSFASRAYRRPVTEPQLRALLKVYSAQRDANASFEAALRTALAATLVSPNFLFRSVANSAPADPHHIHTLDPYELASRLSYFLWSSMPDDALLAAAADGSLLSNDVLAHHLHRMLDDPRSDAFITNFSGQWLQLRTLDTLAIDRARFPTYDDALRSDMTTEATLFFADCLQHDRSVLSFLDSDHTFLNARLAAHYGLTGASDFTGEQFRSVALPPDSPRGGVLTMGAVLTLTSNTTRTSPVKRGLYVLDQILGTPPPPPPPNIPPLEQSAKAAPSATLREQLAAHVANPSCAICHNRLDPLGLSFENFDAVGHWRDTDNGKPIDPSGTLPGNIPVRGPKDLKRILLSRSDQFVENLSAKVLTYAIGRGIEPFDRPAIRQIATQTRAQNDRFSALIESVVLSETFRTCRARTTPHEPHHD